jgi:hypothetical protein
VQVISDVKGKVVVESFAEFGVEGAGTSHRNDMREMTPARPYSVTINDVTDGVVRE